MTHIVYEEIFRDYRIVICHDELDHESPRDWSPFGSMICWHSRYNLGDKHRHHSPYDFLCELAGVDEVCDLSFDDLYARIEKKAVLLPLYLFDHSGLSMRTTPFHCPWDSGRVGFTYATLDQVRCEYGLQRVSGKIRQKAETLLRGEVDSYDLYLRGEVYGYQIIKDDDVIDSCWGFYGDYEDHCLIEARQAVPKSA